MKQKVLKNGAVCWECDQRRNKFACKAKLHVLDDQIIKKINNQAHAVNRGEVQASKVRQEMKKLPRETEETPQQIILNAVARLNDHAVVTMPAVHQIHRDIRQQKKRAGNPIPVPQDRFFDIHPEYQQTAAGEAFLLHDTGNGDNRILVFPTNENIQLLAESQSWFMEVLSKHHRKYSFRSTPSIAALQTEYCLVSIPFFPTNNKLLAIDYSKF